MNRKKIFETIVASIILIFFSFLGYRAYSLNANISEVNYVVTDVGNEYYEKKDETKNIVPILVYHKVGTESILDSFRTREFIVPTKVFEEQIQYILNNGYTPLTVHDLLDKQKNNTLPKKPIAITFDDGWQGQYTFALPILLKYKILATFYIFNNALGKDNYMTLDNVKELQSYGMEIGGHTVHHPHLTQLPTSTSFSEIADNKLFLEESLNTTLSDFAYPYGDFNFEIEKQVQKAGYTSARTSTKTIYNDFSNLYELKSIYATPDLEGLKKVLAN